MALPATDNFNRADSDPIGGNWTAGGVAMKIVTNQVGGSAASDCNAWWNADAFNADHYSKCISPVIADGGPSVRETAGNNYYALYIQGSQLKINKFVSGSATLLGSVFAYTAGTTEVFKLEVTGTTTATLNVYSGTTLLFTRTDSTSPLTTGSAGLQCYGTTTRLDDWEGGNVGAGGGRISRYHDLNGLGGQGQQTRNTGD